MRYYASYSDGALERSFNHLGSFKYGNRDLQVYIRKAHNLVVAVEMNSVRETVHEVRHGIFESVQVSSFHSSLTGKETLVFHERGGNNLVTGLNHILSILVENGFDVDYQRPTNPIFETVNKNFESVFGRLKSRETDS